MKAMRDDGITYEQIGLKFNVTRECVRQILVHGERQAEAEKYGMDIRSINIILRSLHDTPIRVNWVGNDLDYVDLRKQIVSYLNDGGCLKRMRGLGNKSFKRIENFLGMTLVVKGAVIQKAKP